MPRAQCYYEILGVQETATTEDIKKAYKSQALIWHPDKNQANAEEAHAKFQAILKAYETLSDSREREWYDRHKDQILSDGDKDNVGSSINLFQYFSSSCYANFDDTKDGFYTVYRNVFEEIAKEEEQIIEQMSRYQTKAKKLAKTGKTSETTFPTFGNSNSNYEQVVRPFYAFWSGFCTSLTFDHLDKYNTLEAENRRILRAMEKENKKAKDAARKEHNANVRNLVEFVKKRDKRLKAHKLLIEEQNRLNRQKTAEKHKQQRQRSLQQSAQYQPSAWLEMDDIEEQLQELENEYDQYDKRGRRRNRRYEDDVDDEDEDYGDGDDDESICDQRDDDVDQRDDLSSTDCLDEGNATHPTIEGGQTASKIENQEEGEEEEIRFACVICHKDFRTEKALENHEASKKHKQAVLKLTKLLEEEHGNNKS